MNGSSDDVFIQWSKVAPAPDQEPAATFLDALAALPEIHRREQLAQLFGPDIWEHPESAAGAVASRILNHINQNCDVVFDEEGWFARTPTTEVSGSKANLTDSERSDLKRVLYRLRRGFFTAEHLAKRSADERFLLGDAVTSLGGVLAGVEAALCQIRFLDQQAEHTLDTMPAALNKQKSRLIKMWDQQIYAAGHHVLEAFLNRDLENLSSLSKFAIAARDDKDHRSIKVKLKAGGVTKAYHLENVMPVALNRILSRRCPVLASAAGTEFTAARISAAEIRAEVKSTQIAGGGRPSKTLDAASLSVWVNRIGLRPFMVPDQRGRPRKK